MAVKNAAITVVILAWDTAANAAKTGDAANLTVRGIRDGVEFTPSAPNVTQVDATNRPGEYFVSLTAAENNGIDLSVGGKSSTASVAVIPTRWQNVETGDAYAQAALVAADVTTLLSRLSAARAGYLDVLAGWTGTLRQALRAMTSKGAGEASADLTAGGGTFVNTTDSLENLKDSISELPADIAADVAAELGGMGYTVADTDSVSTTTISKRRGDVWTITLLDLGAFGTWTKLWFTVKSDPLNDTDANSIIQILLTNPGAGTDGLQRLNAAAATAAQGSIVVDDSATGDITVTIAAAASAQVVPGVYSFDVQILRAAGSTTMAEGSFTVRRDVTFAVS